MLDIIKEKSPAKINLFLKIINKREDGLHNIRTGVTFVDLFDEIEVQPHNKFEVNYSGDFSPKNKTFEDCIIKRLFTFIKKDGVIRNGKSPSQLCQRNKLRVPNRRRNHPGIRAWQEIQL